MPIFAGGARNVARIKVASYFLRLCALLCSPFSAVKMGGLFPFAAYRRSAPPQVAQANLSTGFWDSVKSFFTGGERKEDGVVESLAENERSIFWGT